MKCFFKKVLILLLGGGLCTLSSCALIFNGTTKNINIKSMTQGSSIYVDGSFRGKDVCSVDLKRNKQHVVQIKKNGYKTELININSHVQVGWVLFDVFFNWFAFLTDPTTGAWCGLDKDNIVVELDPKEQSK